MILKYQATLDDLTEPHIRLHLRGKTYPTQRIKEALWSALAGCGTLYLILKFRASSAPLWAFVLVGFIAGLGIYATFPNTVAKRIRRYLKREYGDTPPYETTYEVTESQLCCQWLKTTVTFDLANLSALENDGKRLDLFFQPGTICSIPHRAFRNNAHLEEFSALVTQEQSTQLR